MLAADSRNILAGYRWSGTYPRQLLASKFTSFSVHHREHTDTGSLAELLETLLNVRHVGQVVVGERVAGVGRAQKLPMSLSAGAITKPGFQWSQDSIDNQKSGLGVGSHTD